LSGASETKPAKKLGRFELSIDWLWRPLFGIALAALAVAAAWEGRWYFAAFLGIGSLAGVREWHRIFMREGYWSYFYCSALAIAGALFAQGIAPDDHGLPWAILAVGALFNLAVYRSGTGLWHAAGVFYVGAAPLSLAILRSAPHGGFWMILAIFLAVWATDTGALIAGNLIGGPKLWPQMSPNKTWAGAFGGAVSAIAVTAILFVSRGGNVVEAAAFGLAMSAVGQAGDLFESWIKRRVGRKNSGSLIPGHGGVLDRIDSILFVAPVVAFAIIGLGYNPLGLP
jgi:phosphatidate cytidylyltransferase